MAVNINKAHYNKAGKFIATTTDQGPLQVNSSHKLEMQAMGLDYENWEDTTTYGVYLFKTQGTSPWNSSAKCWQQ